MVKHTDLLNRLGALGFKLFETEKSEDVNLVLADVVKSRDSRLWEGFPVVLANSASKNLFDYYKTRNYLKKSNDKFNFELLAALSLALYSSLRMKFSWAGALYDLLSAKAKKNYEGFSNVLKKEGVFKLGFYTMSSERLKVTFNNYFVRTGSSLNELLLEKEEFGLEYALSQVFSPKQKDLFLKKLKGEKLTKTEKEYFSRAVKKKVLALANPELHRLSQKLLE